MAPPLEYPAEVELLPVDTWFDHVELVSASHSPEDPEKSLG
jgi:hypothetical protein